MCTRRASPGNPARGAAPGSPAQAASGSATRPTVNSSRFMAFSLVRDCRLDGLAARRVPASRRLLDARRGKALAGPVRVWWLQHTELVAVWVSQDVPVPSGLADRPHCHHLGAEAKKPFDFRFKSWVRKSRWTRFLPRLASGTCCRRISAPLPSGGSKLW